MKKILIAVIATLVLPVFATLSHADEYTAALEELANTKIKNWANSSEVVTAVLAQNAKHSSLDQSAIDALDKKWRAETAAPAKPMIDEVLANSLSAYLKNIKEESAGVYTEIFVMDNKGLNVGQSDVTSDYWQGDEGKFKKSFGAGPDGRLIDEVEFDDSSQTYQSQVSVSIVDPATNTVIGAVTIGVNVESLE
ncbi:MAG: hypothetical protein V7727_17760 [Sneathiella sp.]